MNTEEKQLEWLNFLERITGVPQLGKFMDASLCMAIAELVTYHPKEKPLLKEACSQLRILRNENISGR